MLIIFGWRVVLFTIGKTIIGLYIGSTAVASSYGAAGALIVVLVWIYYSSAIFLLGSIILLLRRDVLE